MLRRLVVLLAVLALVVLVGVGGLVYWLLAGDGVRVALEQQVSGWLGQPVHVGLARPRLFPRPGLRLEKVDVGDPVRLTLGTIDVSSDGRALLSRRIENASVLVTNTHVEMPLPFSLPSESTGAGSASGAIQLVSVGSIELRDVVIASRGRELTISADSALNGSKLLLRRFAARAGRTEVTAEGEVDLSPRIDARLKVKGNRLDVDELVALAGAFAPATTSSTAAKSTTSREPARLVARISAENASAGGVDVRQFATDFELDGSRVSLSPLSFQLFGGRYQGSLVATLRDSITATLKSRLTDIDVAQLAEFGGSAGSVTGTLTGAGTFAGSGKDFAGILGGAHGDATTTITNGSIRHLDLLRTVVLFFGRPAPDAGSSSDRFERMDAAFTLADRVITALAISLHSNDADLVGNGTLSLESKALGGRVDMSLSEALTQQAGTDFARYTREGNRIVLPADIGGTIDHPRITIDAAAAVQRGLRNEIQRRLGDLLDRFKPQTDQPQPK